MIGNVDKDMISTRLGLHTFLVNSYRTKMGINIPEPDYYGILKDFIHLILNIG